MRFELPPAPPLLPATAASMPSYISAAKGLLPLIVCCAGLWTHAQAVPIRVALRARVRAEKPIMAALSGREAAAVQVGARPQRAALLPPCLAGSSAADAELLMHKRRRIDTVWRCTITHLPLQTVELLVTERRRRREGGSEPQWVRHASVLNKEIQSTEWSLVDGSGAELPIEMPLHGGRRLLSAVMRPSCVRL